MKSFYNCEAKDLGVVWYSYNEQIDRLHIYRRLLTNHLHGKAAELCLANRRNNRVTTTKYISTLIASTACVHGMRYSFYHMVLVKFYCDVITIRCLHLINTSIDTFLSKLRAFVAEQRRRRKASDG